MGRNERLAIQNNMITYDVNKAKRAQRDSIARSGEHAVCVAQRNWAAVRGVGASCGFYLQAARSEVLGLLLKVRASAL